MYHRLLSVVLAMLLCFCSPLYALAQDEPLPREADIQKALDGLKDSKLDEAETKARQDVYEATIEQLRALKATKEQQEALAKKLKDAPKRIAEAQRELRQLNAAEAKTVLSRYNSLPQAEQERLVAFKNEQLAAWKNELAQVNSDLIAAQTSPERSQAEIAANQAREQKLNSESKAQQRQNKAALAAEQLTLRRVEARALQQANQLLRQQLAGNAVLLDYGMTLRDLLSRRIAQTEQELAALQNALNERRRVLSEKAVSAATLNPDSMLQDGLLREQNDLNLKLSEELLQATNGIADLTRENMEARQQLDRLGQIEQNLSEQIAVLKDSMLLSKILQQQKKALPHASLDDDLPNRVADIRLRQFELSQERESLRNAELYVAGLLAANPQEELDPALKEELTRLIKARSELLESLNTELGSVLNLAISLQISQQQIQQASDTLQTTLDEQLFWIPSNRPLGLEWIKSLPTQLGDQIAALPWVEAPLEALESFAERPVVAGVLIVLLAGYFYRRRYLLARLADINNEVGQFRKDSAWHTPTALLLNAMLAAPIPLLLYLTGAWLHYSPLSNTPALGAALSQLGLGIFVLHVLYRTLKREGVAERHFRWDKTLVAKLRLMTKKLALVLLPLVFVIGLAEQDPSKLPEDALGVIVMLIGCVTLSILLGRLMLNSPPIYNSRVLHFIATIILILMPLGLLAMTGLGFYYTALKLADRFVFSLYLIVAWIIVSGLAERSLRVAANRLGYQRALAKQEAAAKEGADGDLVADTELDMQQINQQSMRLMQLGLVILFSVLVYLVWADLITVFAYLDGVTLWEYTSGTGESATQVPISVRDLLGALFVVGLTVVLARNLPGLLEMLVLSKLQLRQGSAYAITTLMSYSIIGFGLVSTLSTLGVSWDKLQWLVAALGVGLGFGLQEIFANFISGLIILFERPVRIGDTITIGNLSGTVSRIRIRATTITDPDRKEIIVPNKTFVTDQLINWSLSDTVTRIVLRIGVSYGSDLELVRKLLFQVARQNPRVLPDPEPQVVFLSFAESTLDHELRVHVRELADRLAATDEMNREIARIFKEHQIEIAFRQVDVHLRTSEGLEKVFKALDYRPSNSQDEG